MPVLRPGHPEITDVGVLYPRAAPWQPGPNFLRDTLPAAFRQENLVAAWGNMVREDEYGEPDPGFNALDPDLLRGTLFEHDTTYLGALAHVRNRAHFDAIHEKIRTEIQDRETLERAGGWGFLAAITAGVLSPDVLIPGFGTARMGGHLLLKNAGRTALAAMTGAGAAETFLHEGQYTRTKLESGFAVTGAALFGATLGGFAHVVGAGARTRIGRELDRTLNYEGVDPALVAPDGRLRIAASDVDGPEPFLPVARPGQPITTEQATFFHRIATRLQPETVKRGALVAIDSVRNSVWQGRARRAWRRRRMLRTQSARANARQVLSEAVERFEAGDADAEDVIVASTELEKAETPLLVARTERVSDRIPEPPESPVAVEPGQAPPAAPRRRGVQDIPGIGPALEAQLRTSGIETIDDLAQALARDQLTGVKGLGAKRRAAIARHLDTIADIRKQPVQAEDIDVDPVAYAWQQIQRPVEAATPEEAASFWLRGLDSMSAQNLLAHATRHSSTLEGFFRGEPLAENWGERVAQELAEAPEPRERVIDPVTDTPERNAALHAAAQTSRSLRERLRDLQVRERGTAAGYGLPLRHDQAASALIDEAAEQVAKERTAWRKIIEKGADDLDQAERQMLDAAGTDAELDTETPVMEAQERLDRAQGRFELLTRRRDVFHVERRSRVQRERALLRAVHGDWEGLTESQRAIAAAVEATARRTAALPLLDEAAVGATEAAKVPGRAIPHLRTEGGRLAGLPKAAHRIRADDPRARQLIEKPGIARGVRVFITEQQTAQGKTLFKPSRGNNFGAATILRVRRLRGAPGRSAAQADVVAAQQRLDSTRARFRGLANAEQIQLIQQAVEADNAVARGELVNLGLEDWEIDTIYDQLSRAGQELRSARIVLERAQQAAERAPAKARSPHYMAEVVVDSPTTSSIEQEILRRIRLGEVLLERARRGTPRYREIQRKLDQRWREWRKERTRLGIHQPTKARKDPKTGKTRPAGERLDVAPAGTQEGAVFWVPLRDLDVQLDANFKPIRDDPDALKYVQRARMVIREGALEGAQRKTEGGVYILPPEWRKALGREIPPSPEPPPRWWRRETFAPEEKAIAGRETQEIVSGFVDEGGRTARTARGSTRAIDKPASAAEPAELISFEPGDLEAGRPRIIRGTGSEPQDLPGIGAMSELQARTIEDPALSIDPMLARIRDVYQERVGHGGRLEMEDVLPSRREQIQRWEDQADELLGLPREKDLHPDVRMLRDMGDRTGAMRLQAELIQQLEPERAEALIERADWEDQLTLEEISDRETGREDPATAPDLDDFEYRQGLAESIDDPETAYSSDRLTEEEKNELALRYFDHGPIAGGAAGTPPGAQPIDPKPTVARIARVAGLEPDSKWMQRMMRLNPALRLSVSPSAPVRQVTQALIDTGLWYADNLRGIANRHSVFDKVRLQEAKLHEALELGPKLYYRYLQRVRGKAPKENISIARARVIASLHSLRKRAEGQGDEISYPEFLERTGIASRRRDTDPSIDEVSEYARWIRKEILDPSLRDMVELGKLPAGLRADTAPSYLTRLYNIRAIKERPEEFLQLAEEHFQAKGIEAPRARRMAEELKEAILAGPEGRIPYDAYRYRATRTAKERVFDIDDQTLVEHGFLDNNIETVLRYYYRSVIPDIELMRLDRTLYTGEKRGRDYVPDASLQNVVRRLRAHYEAMIDQQQKQGATKAARFLEGRMHRDLKDIEATIGRLRHTYGIPADPDATLPRIGIALRAFNFLVDSGMFMLSSLPDVARPFMLFGVSRTFRHGLVPMIRDWQSFKINAKEARLAGAAGEWAMARRGLSIFDVGDLYYGRGSRFERGLRRVSQEMGIFSGLIPWNTMMKQWVGTIVSHNIAEDIAIVVGGQTGKHADEALARLAKSGISMDLAHQIRAELAKRPTVGSPGRELLDIGSDQWTNLTARDAFRIAVARDVDLAIVTPGAGDRPLFMSQELGRFMLQYKSFAMAATTRMLVLGLQKPDMAFWNGVAMSVSLGMASLYLKSQAAGWPTPDIDSTKGLFWWLRNGIDRCGVWGILGDINNSVGVATRGGISAGRPFGGIDPGFRWTSRNLLTEIVGPTASTVQDLGKVLEGAGDMARWQAPSIASRNAAKRLAPAQNHFLLSRAYDRLFRSAHRGLVGTLDLERPQRPRPRRKRRVRTRQPNALYAEAAGERERSRGSGGRR